MKRKHLTETLVCPRECLVIISNTTGLSFDLGRIGPLASIITIVFYLLVLYLLALSNTPENLFASIYSESLIKTACNTFCSSLGLTLLFIESTKIHPLYLWVINNIFRRRCRRVKRYWRVELVKEIFAVSIVFISVFYFILSWRSLHLVPYLGILLPLLW
jgi:hypothetical protein